MGYKTLDCPVSRACGGCEWLAVPYPIQLERKQAYVEKCFEGMLEGVDVRTIIGMEDPRHFRCKVIATFKQAKNGTVRYGLYARGSHRIVERSECLVEHEVAAPLLETICKLARSFKLKVYDEKSGRGFLRYALIRVARGTGQVLVCLVCTGDAFQGSRAFVKELRKAHPEVATVVVNVNDRNTNVVLGTRETVLHGPGWIEEELLGMRFRMSSQSFFQVNPQQTARLYGTAIELARLTGRETIVDAYCGTGTIGLLAAQEAGRLIGIEESKQAIRDARANAKRNKVAHAEFIADDAGRHLRMLAAGDAKVDVVFMDPPRSGSDEVFLDSVAQLKPGRVVYISCNPQTQARDIAHLIKAGYHMKALQPVDMFPHAKHIETVALLERGR